MPPASLRDLAPWARELLDVARVGHLGILDDDGAPRVLPVTFAVVAGAVWSAVDDKPKRRPAAELARVRWLRTRARSSLTVDHYDDDWGKLAWVQLVGRTEILGVDGHEDVIGALASRYPQYREHRPGGPLLRLEPERALSWRATGRG